MTQVVRTGAAGFLFHATVLLCFSAASPKPFTAKDVQTLVANVPDALLVKRRGGCLATDYSDIGGNLALVQLRNLCPKGGSGLIGNYVVDLRSGRIWEDVDQKKEIDSRLLRKLRNQLRAEAGRSRTVK
jgi:hypothetical protein